MDRYTVIQHYIMPDVPPQKADIAILFGTRHGIEEFCQVTFDLWQNGIFPTLVISGGATLGIPQTEASVIAEKLIAMGMPRATIWLEQKATNTGENVIFSKNLIAQKIDIATINSILAIGKIYASRRTLMTLEKYWPGPKKLMAPVNFFATDKNLWHSHALFQQKVLAEFRKIPLYMEQGFLADIPGLSKYPDNPVKEYE